MSKLLNMAPCALPSLVAMVAPFVPNSKSFSSSSLSAIGEADLEGLIGFFTSRETLDSILTAATKSTPAAELDSEVAALFANINLEERVISEEEPLPKTLSFECVSNTFRLLFSLCSECSTPAAELKVLTDAGVKLSSGPAPSLRLNILSSLYNFVSIPNRGSVLQYLLLVLPEAAKSGSTASTLAAVGSLTECIIVAVSNSSDLQFIRNLYLSAYESFNSVVAVNGKANVNSSVGFGFLVRYLGTWKEGEEVSVKAGELAAKAIVLSINASTPSRSLLSLVPVASLSKSNTLVHQLGQVFCSSGTSAKTLSQFSAFLKAGGEKVLSDNGLVKDELNTLARLRTIQGLANGTSGDTVTYEDIGKALGLSGGNSEVEEWVVKAVCGGYLVGGTRMNSLECVVKISASSSGEREEGFKNENGDWQELGAKMGVLQKEMQSSTAQ
ncbi:hypothetical protein ScalyP_jg8969 [Parmales sp. scaly parma]|nr:hypothetical protein ScalyP_jg8969 [Parmales sp. scaly parma]